MDAVRVPRARALPWVACDLPLEPGIDRLGDTGRVTGLSIEAIRVEGVPGLADGAEVRLGFRLPGQRTLTVITGRAEAGEPAPGQRVVIEGFDAGAERAYQQYVLGRVGADALERQAEALTTPAGRLIPLTDVRRIRELLADSLAYKADALVQGPDLLHPMRALLSGVTPTELLLTSDAAGRNAPLAGTRVRCSLLSRHGPYLFEADVRGRSDGQLRLSFPEQLHQYEKRAEVRVVLNADRAPATDGPPRDPDDAEVPDRIIVSLPSVYGGVIERPLLDVSDGGAAFRSRAGDPLFLPGTPLPDVVLVREGVATAPRPAEVRQVALEDEGGGRPRTFRVGLALDVERGRPARPATPPPAPAAHAPGFLARMAQDAGPIGRVLRRAQAPVEAMRARAAAFRARARSGGPLVNVARYRGPAGEPLVALLNTTRAAGLGSRLRGPLVIIPPAYGKTKETYSALAVMLTETFRRHGQDVVVVRYDGAHAVGESHKEPENWPEERQMIRYTLSQGAHDLKATLDHFHGRPWFRPTHTVIVSFSLAALWTRRVILDDDEGRITHWMSVVGAPDAQEVILNATGGVDVFGARRMGVSLGPITVLSHLVDAERFSADAVEAGLASLTDARRDLALVKVPVTWFVGRDDRWVRSERVYDVLGVAAPAPREVYELPVGHTMRSSAEALASFDTIIRHLWRQLYGEAPLDTRIDEAHLKRVASLERGRLPRRRLGEARAYWEKYLLGEDGRGVAWDLWATTPAYRELLDLTRQLLDVSEGDVVADLGAGTGNFTEHLLDRMVRDGFRTSPKRLVVADLVPAALEVARGKAARALEAVLLPSDFLEFRELNLETSRLRPIRRFLSGEFASLDGLRGLVDGLPDATIDAWLAAYDDRLHGWLRGAAPDGALRDHVARVLKGADLEVALEFNRAARWVLGRLAPEDLSAEMEMSRARALLSDPRGATAPDLRFRRLRFDGPGVYDALPFPDESLDKVVLSLVLSYLFHPGETVREVHRILRPGGRIVASTMRPDADMSLTVEMLVEQLAAQPETARRFGVSPDELLTALQRYLSQAAGLLDLEEGGVFRFFSRDEITRLLEAAGFDQVKVYESFGRPPQAFVAVGVKR